MRGTAAMLRQCRPNDASDPKDEDARALLGCNNGAESCFISCAPDTAESGWEHRFRRWRR